MPGLPAGTITFLFTDIEGSTRLLQGLGDRYASVLADYHRLMRAACGRHGGEERETQGDGLFFTFSSARAALLAAVTSQRAVSAHVWADGVSVRVRMGIHTGEPITGETGYVGIDIHRAARICAAGWGGQILISQATRDLIHEELLQGIGFQDLGEHRLKDLTRPERLYQVVAGDLSEDFPPLRSLDALPHNLPIQLTTFIGREREIAEVRRLLTTARLFTLTGVGGCGKTRLALQVAAEEADGYPQGVWVVELAALAAPELVPQSVAVVLGVREEQHRPITDTLVEHLRTRKLLMVLDNCEHLLAACARLADVLLRRCPDLRILATSREGFGIPGEVLYPVPSLSAPDPQDGGSADALLRYESVRLFVERATARLPRFSLTEQNAGAVAQVCHRLDGLPLAIELAVARIGVLPVEQIARRLDDQFRLLTGGSRTALPHHQTLQASIDWSYALLSEAERAVFRRLAAFVGGWPLEAAEAVCAGEGIEQADALDLLTQLVGKSLVIAETQGGEGRYRLLEPIRQYAREKLMASGEGEAVRTRHFGFFLELAEQAESGLRTPDQLAWLRRLELEHDNMRAALEWTRSRGDAEAGLRLAGTLFRFWYLRGFLNEGRSWIEGLLASATPVRTRVRAKALRAAAMFARDRFEHEAADARFAESLAIYRELNDRHGIADVLLGTAWMPVRRGDYAAARALYAECLSICREIGYDWAAAETLHMLGHVELGQSEYGRALTLFEESVARFRAMGNRWSLAHPLTDLGREALRRGDYARARALFEESLAVFAEFGGKGSIAMALDDLGDVALAEGDLATARARLEESLRLNREIGYKSGIIDTLNDLAEVALRRGEHYEAHILADEALTLSTEVGIKSLIGRSLSTAGMLALHRNEPARADTLLRESLGHYRELGEQIGILRVLRIMAQLAWITTKPGRAARLFAAADNLSEAIGVPLRAVDRSEHDRTVGEVQTTLGREAFDAAWAEGRAMTVEQAVTCALEDPVTS